MTRKRNVGVAALASLLRVLPAVAGGGGQDGDREFGDGVRDGPDKCPGTPAGTAVGPDGCPKK